jgi:hypothetical protein
MIVALILIAVTAIDASVYYSVRRRISALERDSHPPRPVVSGTEFDRYKQYVDRRFNRIEQPRAGR